MFIVTILLAITISCVHSQTQLTLVPLPYAYNALEPVLSETLMRLHHDKHFHTYVNKTNQALNAMFADKETGGKLKELSTQPIEVLLTQLKGLPEHYHLALRYNGGGYINHKLFFQMLRAPTPTAAENKPTGVLLQAIESAFGSFDKFREAFSVASVNYFGSGWVWLYIEGEKGKLVLNYTVNQDNPIMFNKDNIVLLGIDLWEHAYYPVYQNRRNEYVENFWRIVNWDFVTRVYNEAPRRHNDL